MAANTWSDEENDAIVAQYFAMLADDLSRRPYTKAQYNRAIQAATGRGRGSVEYKLQNISAVLKGFGTTWITGYKPAFNFQFSLAEAVSRWLNAHPDWAPAVAATQGFADAEPLWIGPPPTQRNTPPPDELEQMQAIARKFDVAGRDERNRALGKAGEECVLAHELSTLRRAGRDDLASRVRWTSQQDGDGAGYDIASFTPDGSTRLIEVKTTNGWERTPFHITRNELEVADANRETWSLVRLYDFARQPRAFEIRPPLDAHLSLTATSFQASFH